MKAWLAPLTLLLACLPKAESPPFHPDCDDDREYPYSGICCLLCPAGTHVDEPCVEAHTRGRCRRCTEGEDYTEHRNGLPQCLPCDECKYGKIKVTSCTVKSNTKCQCRDGYYCPPVCEECIRCTEKCPEGQIIVQKCNATADMKCGTPPGEDVGPTTKYIIIGVVIFVVLVCVLLLCLFIKWPCNGSKRREDVKDALISVSKETLNPKADDATSENWKVRSSLGDPPSHLGSEFPEIAERSTFLVSNAIDLCEEPRPGITPSAPPLPLPDGASNRLESNTKCPEVIIINPSHEELNTLYYDVRLTVPHRHWKMLVRRMGLSDNDIDKIIRDNPNQADEQDYQMLKTLQDRFGIEEALCQLIYRLWDMKLMNIYENLYNELINNGIIALKTN